MKSLSCALFACAVLLASRAPASAVEQYIPRRESLSQSKLMPKTNGRGPTLMNYRWDEYQLSRTGKSGTAPRKTLKAQSNRAGGGVTSSTARNHRGYRYYPTGQRRSQFSMNPYRPFSGLGTGTGNSFR